MNNKWFVVYAKMCFICSIFFFVFVIARFASMGISDTYTYLAGFVITVAFLSFLLNFIATSIQVVFLLKGMRNLVPLWIIATIIFTFFFQLFFFLFV